MQKGILYYLFDSVVFLFCGYAIHIGLGRYLGAAQYGIFGVIISLSTMSFIFFNYGVRNAVSKYTAEDSTLSFPILISGLKVQIFFGSIITAAMLLLADIIAGWLHDHTLSPLIRLSALAILPLASYEIYAGVLNGNKEFGKHAISTVSYSVSKVFAIFLFVLSGFGVKGAIGGYIVAAIVGLVVARGFCHFQKIKTTFSPQKIFMFSLPLIGLSTTISFLMNIDLVFIKSILKDNALTGYYTAASNLARPLFYLSAAFAGVLLPSVSMSSSNNDIDLTKKYIHQGLRYTLMLLMPLTFMITGTAESLAQLLYSNKFFMAGKPLSILIFGYLLFSLFSICSTFITAIGKPGLSLSFALLIVPIDVILNLFFIPTYGIAGAALATSMSLLVGLLVAGLYIFREYKTLVNLFSFLRILVASLIVYVLSITYPTSGIALVGQYCYLFLGYVGVLFLLREIQADDLQPLKDLLVDVIDLKFSKRTHN